MIVSTAVSSTESFSCNRRTMSRSETMPSSCLPSLLTTSAPMFFSASRVTSSRTVASGAMVTAPVMSLASTMSLMRMVRG